MCPVSRVHSSSQILQFQIITTHAIDGSLGPSECLDGYAKELNSKWGTICTPVVMLAPDGKKRKTQAADLEGIFHIIQSIPSKKAEPVRRWLAELGSQRGAWPMSPRVASST